MRRQARGGVGQHTIHVFFGLTHGKPANRITRKIEIDQTLQRFLAQVFHHAALNNAKQCIGVLQSRKFFF